MGYSSVQRTIKDFGISNTRFMTLFMYIEATGTWYLVVNQREAESFNFRFLDSYFMYNDP